MAVVLPPIAVLSSCARSHFLESADRETSQIIKHKGAAIPNMERDFTIDPPQPPSLAHFPKSRKTYEYLGDAAAVEMGATIVTLADALSDQVTNADTDDCANNLANSFTEDSFTDLGADGCANSPTNSGMA